MSLESRFEVDVWYAKGIYDRISDINHPDARLSTDFYAGSFEGITNDAVQANLFDEMALSIHVDPDRHDEFQAIFQARYRNPSDAIWTPEDVIYLSSTLMTENPEYSTTVMKHESSLTFFTAKRGDQLYIVRPFRQGLSESMERVFGVNITSSEGVVSFMTLDQNPKDFDKRVNGWADFICNLVNCAVKIKNSTQTGVLKIGTIRYRNFMNPEIERDFGV